MSFLDPLLSGVKFVQANGVQQSPLPGLNFTSGLNITPNPSNGTYDVSSVTATITGLTNVSNATLLRALPGTSVQAVFAMGVANNGDGGHGLFTWIPSGTLADDGWVVFAATGGVWVRSDALGPNGQIARAMAQWFGGLTNAAHYNSGNGKWYVDAGLTTEATDDMLKFQNAATWASGYGLPSVEVPDGSFWYAKTKHGNPNTGTAGNEFVLWKSGLSLVCVGTKGWKVFIAGGVNTVGFGGYSCVFGDWSTGTTYQDCNFQGLIVDHNGANNLWYAATSTLAIANIRNAAVLFRQSQRCTVRQCTSINSNGVNAFYLGDFGAVANTTDLEVEDVSVLTPVHDSNLSDASLVSVGAVGAVVRNSRTISYVTGNVTGFEVHGQAIAMENIYAQGLNGGVNIGADSAGNNLDSFRLDGFSIIDCTVSINLFNQNSNLFNHWSILNGTIRNSTGSGFPGIQLIGGNGSTTPYGAGYKHGLIENVNFYQQHQTTGEFAAIDFQAFEGGDGITIANCRMHGFNDGTSTGAAIRLGTGTATGSNGWHNVLITGNIARDCGGATGGYIAELLGVAGDASPQFTDIRIVNNFKEGTTHHGVHITGYTDASCLVINSGDTVADNTHYSAQATGGAQLVELVGNGSTTTTAAYQSINRTPATSGATSQTPGAYTLTGFYWTGSASAEADAALTLTSGAGPVVSLQTNDNLAGWKTVFTAFYDAGNTRSVWGTQGSLVMDMLVGGSLLIQDTNSVAWMQLSATNLILTSPSLIWASGSSSPSITQLAPSSDVTPQSFTMSYQPPFPSATGTHRVSQDFIWQVPAGVGGQHGGFLRMQDDNHNDTMVVQTGGSMRRHAVRIVSANTTFDSTNDASGRTLYDESVYWNNSGSAATITLPTLSAAYVGRWAEVVDYSGAAATHNITVSAGGGNTINGAGSYTITTNGGAVTLRAADASHWVILSSR